MDEWRDAPRRARRRLLFPLTLAVLLQVVTGVVVAAHGARVAGLLDAALALAAFAVLLVVRRHPGPAVVAVGVLSLTGLLLVPGPPTAVLPFAVAVVVAVVRGAQVWALAAAAGAIVLPVEQLLVADSPAPGVRSLGVLVVLLAAAGVGTRLRDRIERERIEDAARRRLVAEEERVRIARELHDVLAHSLTSISVQAGVGLHLASNRPEAAVAALETIRTASREALDEIRGVLGVLRSGDAAPRDPGTDVARLVEEQRAQGVDVELHDELEPRPVPQVALALYRIVQESLTNARRHAPGAAVRVLLGWEGERVVVRVRDRVPGAVRPPEVVPGNGITGMRERVALLGGELAVVPMGDGLEVVARIPAIRQGAAS